MIYQHIQVDLFLFYILAAIFQSRAPMKLEKQIQFRMKAPRFWTVRKWQDGQHVGSQRVGAFNVDEKQKTLRTRSSATFANKGGQTREIA